MALEALAGQPGARAILILTDAETGSFDRAAELWATFAGTRPRVFAVHLAASVYPNATQNWMQDWAAVNRGHYAYVYTQGDIDVAFDRAAASLRRPAIYAVSVEGTAPPPTPTPEPTSTPTPSPTPAPAHSHPSADSPNRRPPPLPPRPPTDADGNAGPDRTRRAQCRRTGASAPARTGAPGGRRLGRLDRRYVRQHAPAARRQQPRRRGQVGVDRPRDRHAAAGYGRLAARLRRRPRLVRQPPGRPPPTARPIRDGGHAARPGDRQPRQDPARRLAGGRRRRPRLGTGRQDRRPRHRW